MKKTEILLFRLISIYYALLIGKKYKKNSPFLHPGFLFKPLIIFCLIYEAVHKECSFTFDIYNDNPFLNTIVIIGKGCRCCL